MYYLRCLLLILGLSLLAVAPSRAVPPQWQYTFTTQRELADLGFTMNSKKLRGDEAVQAALDDYGLKGWELITITVIEDSFNNPNQRQLRYTFKRQLP